MSSTSPNSPPSAESPVTVPPPSSTNSTSPPPSSDSPPPLNSPPPPQPSEAPPPLSSSPPPPPPSSDSPPPWSSPPPQPSTPPVTAPPPQTPPPVTSSPPPIASSPPPQVTSTPPPIAPSPPPPVTSSPPPIALSPPPLVTPPVSPSSPPPPTNSRPPPSLNPPQSSPAPPSKPPENAPPPTPQSKPPVNSSSPPSPPSITPEKSPPSPPPPKAPSSSSPPPPANPPKKSPVPTPSTPSPPSRTPTPIRPASEPVSSPPSRLSPPSSTPVTPSTDPPASSSVPSPPIASNSEGIGTTGAVAIGVVAGFIGLGFIALAIWFFCIRKRRNKSGHNAGHIMPSTVASSIGSDSSSTKAHSSAPILGTGSSSSVTSPAEPGGLGNSRPLFTHDDLVKATNGFSAQNLLGEGGFGSVYKGYLLDGRVVAVKQLKIGGGQGEREFKAEVETISRIHHRHLVSLVGYCISENQRLLVYEYVPNNPLYFHLHGKDQPVLDWAKRVKIAAGAARGIAYLHEDCHPRIIHRDIKSSNILLDDNFDARVSDFGLAKIALDMYTHITTHVMGTFGYMAPEYASSGKLTDKSDVYSFGVVLLELITGRKPVDTSQPLGDESLVEWARPLLSHAVETENFEGLADPRLEGNYVGSEMFRMIEAAAACVRHSAAKRPRMAQVARAFDSVASYDLTNGMKPGQSEVFNSAQQSEEIRFFRRMAFGSQNYSTDFFSTNV